MQLDESGGTVDATRPSVRPSLRDKSHAEVLASYQLVASEHQNRGLGQPSFYVPDARHC